MLAACRAIVIMRTATITTTTIAVMGIITMVTATGITIIISPKTSINALPLVRP